MRAAALLAFVTCSFLPAPDPQPVSLDYVGRLLRFSRGRGFGHHDLAKRQAQRLLLVLRFKFIAKYSAVMCKHVICQERFTLAKIYGHDNANLA